MKLTINGTEYTIEPDADLSGATLSGADLSGATLRGAIIPLGRIEPGIWSSAYRVVEGQLIIYAGGATFTADQALAHWGSADYPDPLSGKAYCLTVEYLQRMLEAGVLLGA